MPVFLLLPTLGSVLAEIAAATFVGVATGVLTDAVLRRLDDDSDEYGGA